MILIRIIINIEIHNFCILFSLPLFFGTLGVWLAFPLADLLATIVTVYFLNKAIRKELI